MCVKSLLVYAHKKMGSMRENSGEDLMLNEEDTRVRIP